ncbi:MAG: hypothetical protein IJK97_07450, partial [Thermoguttaceae bacterium]|nr:hypothetical protein [Thermoguttaceae bacterium]
MGISYPRENSNGPVVFTATDITTRKEGTYTVYVLAGKCHLRQGNDSFRADKMVLWVGPVQLDETSADSETPASVQPVLLYLEDDVEIEFVTSRTTSRVKGKTWAGRLTASSISNVAAETAAAPELDALYKRAFDRMFQPAKLLLTDFSDSLPSFEFTKDNRSETPVTGAGTVVPAEQPLHTADGTETLPDVLSTHGEIRAGDVSSFDPNIPKPGTRKIGFFQRNDVPLEMRFSYDEATHKSVAIFDKGVMLLIDGADEALKGMKNFPANQAIQIGTIDISADRLVVWSDVDLSQISQDYSLDLTNNHVELYMEGNIIFRQGDQEIYAEKMYFDVSTHRGLIREAEVFATIPNVEGLIRLRAEEIRMPEEGVLMAND